jgi:hypothetical protein
MGLDGTTVAAIVTGFLALAGAVATAWMSGWNEERTQARANKKALSRYSVPLMIAAWDLANWFYDILEEDNYTPERCAAYGNGWTDKFTSYLLGQYFAGVHIVREMTHFFAHIDGEEAEMLKKLLWKIQDEFISMHYDGRENLEMRWFEGDILAAQEHLTEAVLHDGTKFPRELRTIGYVEFQKKYAPASEPGNANSPELYKLFEWYEVQFQRIIYRRFKSLYTNKWPTKTNPQAYKTLKETLDTYDGRKLEKDALEERPNNQKKRRRLEEEEERIQSERELYPNISVIVPDHRVRRLQHLLSDLVEVLDAFTSMKLHRPVRKCKMLVEHKVSSSNNPLDLVTEDRIPCDCTSLECNPKQESFRHRQLLDKKGRGRFAWRRSSMSSQRTLVRHENACLERTHIVERSKV